MAPVGMGNFLERICSECRLGILGCTGARLSLGSAPFSYWDD
jgi:hypothetical protein